MMHFKSMNENNIGLDRNTAVPLSLSICSKAVPQTLLLHTCHFECNSEIYIIKNVFIFTIINH